MVIQMNSKPEEPEDIDIGDLALIPWLPHIGIVIGIYSYVEGIPHRGGISLFSSDGRVHSYIPKEDTQIINKVCNPVRPRNKRNYGIYIIEGSCFD